MYVDAGSTRARACARAQLASHTLPALQPLRRYLFWSLSIIDLVTIIVGFVNFFEVEPK